MTLGEKIKYLRIKKGFTPDQLGQASGIHPASIRKYEANTMYPQQEQIIRICKALQISPFTLLDWEYEMSPFNDGDVYGFIVHCVKHNLMQIRGDRDTDGKLIAKTMYLTIEGGIMSRFAARAIGWNLKPDNTLAKLRGKNEFRACDLEFRITKKQDIDNLLQWEQAHSVYKQAKYKGENSTDEAVQAEIEDLKTARDLIEMEYFVSYPNQY